ncbi:MAG: flippase-like domain-containing protein [Candidatus Thermoplasmatota archaeon]|nr:flippase-like domain-containing protein [Candidatus Thermoplasmatota archaeon]
MLTIPGVIIRNYAWQIVLKEQGIQISFLQSLKVFLIGYFYGIFTPGFYGQLMRIPYLKEKTGQPYGKLFVTTFIEITMRSFSIYLMILIGALIFLSSIKEIFYVILVWFIIFSSVIFYFIKKERGEKIFNLFVKYFIPKRFKVSLNSFLSTFYNDFPRIRILILPVLLSIITWILIFTQYYIFVIALGLQIPYIAFLFLFPIANVAGYIPITIAGLGIREITAITIFTTIYNVTKEEILVVALLGFIITDIVTGFVGFLLSLTETVDKKSFLKA